MTNFEEDRIEDLQPMFAPAKVIEEARAAMGELNQEIDMAARVARWDWGFEAFERISKATEAILEQLAEIERALEDLREERRGKDV
jgi:hypothetical protein